jgi:hypothetical protein
MNSLTVNSPSVLLSQSRASETTHPFELEESIMSQQFIVGNTTVTELDEQNLVGKKKVISAFDGFVVWTDTFFAYFKEINGGRVEQACSRFCKGDKWEEVMYIPQFKVLCVILNEEGSSHFDINLLDENLNDVTANFTTTVNENVHPTSLLDHLILEKGTKSMYYFLYSYSTSHLGLIIDRNQAYRVELYNDKKENYSEYLLYSVSYPPRLSWTPKFSKFETTTPVPEVPKALKGKAGDKFGLATQRGSTIAMISKDHFFMFDLTAGLERSHNMHEYIERTAVAEDGDAYFMLNNGECFWNTLGSEPWPKKVISMSGEGPHYRTFCVTEKHLVFYSDHAGLALYDRSTMRPLMIKADKIAQGMNATVINNISHMKVLPDYSMIKCYSCDDLSLITKESPSAIKHGEFVESACFQLNGETIDLFPYNDYLTVCITREGVHMIENKTLKMAASITLGTLYGTGFDSQLKLILVSWGYVDKMVLIKFDEARNIFTVIDTYLSNSLMDSMDPISKRIYLNERKVVPYDITGFQAKKVYGSSTSYYEKKCYTVPGTKLIACIDSKTIAFIDKTERNEKIIASFPGTDIFQLLDGNFVFLQGQEFTLYSVSSGKLSPILDFTGQKLGAFKVLWFNVDLVKEVEGLPQCKEGLFAMVKSEVDGKVYSIYSRTSEY